MVSVRLQSLHVMADDKTTPKGGVKVYDGILIHERHRLGWPWFLSISLGMHSDLQSVSFWLCLDIFGELCMNSWYFATLMIYLMVYIIHACLVEVQRFRKAMYRFG